MSSDSRSQSEWIWRSMKYAPDWGYDWPDSYRHSCKHSHFSHCIFPWSLKTTAGPQGNCAVAVELKHSYHCFKTYFLTQSANRKANKKELFYVGVSVHVKKNIPLSTPVLFQMKKTWVGIDLFSETTKWILHSKGRCITQVLCLF